MGKDNSIVIKDRTAFEPTPAGKQGAPHSDDGFDAMGKKSDKSTTSGKTFTAVTKENKVTELEAEMGKKGSGGYNKTLPDNGVFSDNGFTPMGKSGNGRL